jgi:hypothetical protein
MRSMRKRLSSTEMANYNTNATGAQRESTTPPKKRAVQMPESVSPKSNCKDVQLLIV